MGDNYHMYNGREGLDQNGSRVYINPNFKRIERNMPLPHSSMHVNPNFPQLLPNNPYKLQRTITGNSKIYVNPNFIRANNNATKSVYYDSRSVIPADMLPKDNRTTIHNSNIKIDENFDQPHNRISTVVPLPAQKSRYHVVRGKAEDKNNDAQPIINKVTTTVKINRYKSVPLLDVKKNLQTVKPAQKLSTKLINQQAHKQRCKKFSSSPKILENRFKFIKRNIESVPYVNSELKSTAIRKSLNMKNLLRSNLKAKIKTNTKLLKKNNIPCPLFKKYGKCLRNIHGHCEFLHDKKHVSICRRFLKGACHDKECLLSHDLTVQKMPTCSFYLKGMCTKEGCPYLHVKLNEKAKLCTDFLKGFCEKGDKCLNRHINITPDMKKGSEHLNKMGRVRNVKNINQSFKSSTQTKKSSKSKTIKDTSTQETKVADCRYYKEDANDASTSMCEIIKPTRCKLGTLPSFIQL